ncbi:MAG: lysophospholipid acyltransferase family protein [bacterium]|nr:lysophospholipid acyltransferase family protein [bacterium]
MKDVILYRITRPLIKAFMKIFFRPTYIGTELIPTDVNFILAGNHTSYLDPLLLMSSTNKTIHFLAKDSLAKGIKGLLFRSMGIIPVNRKIHDKNALKTAEEELLNKKVIGIFPEGTINRTEEVTIPFKIGAVKMAQDTDALLVPFTITGKYKLFRKSVTIEFYSPYKVKEDLTIENEKLRGFIGSELKRKRVSK